MLTAIEIRLIGWLVFVLCDVARLLLKVNLGERLIRAAERLAQHAEGKALALTGISDSTYAAYLEQAREAQRRKEPRPKNPNLEEES